MRVLVFQHLPVEHPGVFREFWSEAGIEWVAVELDEGEPIPPLEDFDLMAVMGGPMDVWQEDLHPWLAPEKAAIRRWVVDLERPYIGICLGHQLLAEALGGNVQMMAGPEVGLSTVFKTDAGRSDALLAGFPDVMETFQWHGAEITQVPEGATILASNPHCQTQAIRWGRHAYGLQYHVEITASTVSEWQSVPEYKESLEAALGVQEAQRLQHVVDGRLTAFRRSALTLHENLLRILHQFALAPSAEDRADPLVVSRDRDGLARGSPAHRRISP